MLATSLDRDRSSVDKSHDCKEYVLMIKTREVRIPQNGHSVNEPVWNRCLRKAYVVCECPR